MENNKPKGNYIETLASAYLSREGYQVIARNYAYMGGELDIVARDGGTLVFVEVKSVWNNQQGNPAARVNALKQKKIWKTACHFLATQKEHAPKGFDTPLSIRCVDCESLPKAAAIHALQECLCEQPGDTASIMTNV